MNGLALVAALALAQTPGAEDGPAPSPPEKAAAAAPRTSGAPGIEAAAPARPRATQPPPLGAAEAERAARAFLDALARGDVDALAGAGSERFSFDGDLRSGRVAVQQTWRSLFAGRGVSPPPRIGDVEVLAVEVAIARHGNPPARLAPLARPGAFVAIADVGGRTVVLFLARESGRVAVLGMQG